MPTRTELKMLQALPLEIKILKTHQRIREWINYYGVDGVYISFSGGKDSTVLLDIVRGLYPTIEAVFVDTGLEYPEIRQFVKGFENVIWLRPKMRFDEVIKKYGYPIISKEVADCIQGARKGQLYRIERLNGTLKDKAGNLSMFNHQKWKPLLDLPCKISHYCCNIMKKEPVKKYEKLTGKVGITGQIAEESILRQTKWLQAGCNGFMMKSPISSPLSFWTNQDILQYIKENSLQISSIYGEIVDSEFLKNGQLCCEGCETWKTTGAERTGCIFCLFGMHLEKGETRLQRLHRTHPKLYDYCMNGGEFVDGNWQPNQQGLGMRYVCDEVNRVMGKELLKY
jgi:3'-phosphoadenosine 5'-phosphosulfate sulfotransferase (PAPS reductase)/FAD synthetase